MYLSGLIVIRGNEVIDFYTPPISTAAVLHPTRESGLSFARLFIFYIILSSKDQTFAVAFPSASNFLV